MSNPVERLLTCREQLKRVQEHLRQAREYHPDNPKLHRIYERYLYRELDEVWAAQIDMIVHLNETLAPNHFWPYCDWKIGPHGLHAHYTGAFFKDVVYSDKWGYHD